ncbi:transient receptor potential channel pyrexia-like [Diabrotica undecimpunctata]
MMMGEFEYGDMFAEDEDSPKILPATSRFIFLIFVILTSIVLMNLMVGVAVSDIQELHRRGRAKKLEKQAEFLHQLEKVISSKHLNSEYMPEIIKRVILKRSYIHNEFEVKSCAEFQRQNKIPKRIIDSITAIAKSHKQFKEEN